MELIKIARIGVRKFSQVYDIKKYSNYDSDSILVHDYMLMSNKIKISNRK